MQHVSTLSKALHSEPASAQAWMDTAREILLSQGWEGIKSFVQLPQLPSPEAAEPRTPAQQSAVDSLLDYLSPHQRHLNYAERLATGRSIGSGQIEGACKNLIGRRLKANAARWRIRRINRMADLCSLLYSDQWKTYWQTL